MAVPISTSVRHLIVLVSRKEPMPLETTKHTVLELVKAELEAHDVVWVTCATFFRGQVDFELHEAFESIDGFSTSFWRSTKHWATQISDGATPQDIRAVLEQLNTYLDRCAMVLGDMPVKPTSTPYTAVCERLHPARLMQPSTSVAGSKQSGVDVGNDSLQRLEAAIESVDLDRHNDASHGVRRVEGRNFSVDTRVVLATDAPPHGLANHRVSLMDTQPMASKADLEVQLHRLAQHDVTLNMLKIANGLTHQVETFNFAETAKASFAQYPKAQFSYCSLQQLVPPR
eukprot:m.221684 g.221684  ORF g.221684 m.221684 type:complete len:286 (-) comp15130_c0_seq2:531-1388(-)